MFISHTQSVAVEHCRQIELQTGLAWGFPPATHNPGGDSLQLSPPYQHSYLTIVEGDDKKKNNSSLSDRPSAYMDVSPSRKSTSSECHCAASVNEFQSGIHSSKPPHYAELRLGLSAVQHKREREGEKEKEKERIENERRSCCSIELCLIGRAQEV